VTGPSEVPNIFELQLRAVRHTATSNTKYRAFEHALADLLGVPAGDIYAAHIDKPGNFDVRMTQSGRAREAKIRVGVMPSKATIRGDLADNKSLALRTAREKYPGTSVLLVCDGQDGWRPAWATEPDRTTPAASLSRLASEYAGFELFAYEQTLARITLESAFELTEQEKLTLTTLLSRPEAPEMLYALEPGLFRRLIETDVSANDVIAIAHRRTVIDRFRRLLEDPEFFQNELKIFGKPEAVWQNLLEENPWILGVSLAGQLLTGWDKEKLEQVVAGSSIAGPGKRTDALMRTNGAIRAMVFAEIKHHETHLLGTEYRTGCWAPSPHLAGGVVQIQQTVRLAVKEIGERLADKDETGAETGEYTYLVHPRQFLILGNLSELQGEHGIHPHKYESFELFRRSVSEPEILTFDELLARAEWHVLGAAPPSSPHDDQLSE
jgi:Domain of unknown function (DUF4263)